MAGTGNPYLEGNDVGGVQSGGLLKVSVGAGAASGSLVEVAGMTADDVVISAINTSDWSDITANVTSVAASGFKASVDSSSDDVLVHWIKRQLAP